MSDEIKERVENSERDLRIELAKGVISGKEFLEEILRRDQSDGERSMASDNVEILKHPDVAGFFHRPENAGELFEYQNLLSLSYFHIGQKFAGLGLNEQALVEFEDSLKIAEQVDVAENEGYEDWVQYIRATIAYLHNDSKGLEKSMEEVKDPRNVKILESFLKGLGSRGGPDYSADSQESLLQ